ncbi:MAG: hypothetical protein CM15mP120_01010 [Pseudomonadota bacterium]|nr:MAG: hypothetical protein CM15mP120_01010 [Pseudomonadota bacterium]
MVETMNREGFKALIHTAAASNLGQMLQKICLNDGVALVNIVRKPEQAEMRSVGATMFVTPVRTLHCGPHRCHRRNWRLLSV